MLIKEKLNYLIHILPIILTYKFNLLFRHIHYQKYLVAHIEDRDGMSGFQTVFCTHRNQILQMT